MMENTMMSDNQQDDIYQSILDDMKVPEDDALRSVDWNEVDKEDWEDDVPLQW